MFHRLGATSSPHCQVDLAFHIAERINSLETYLLP